MRTAVDTNVLSALWSREPLASQMAMLLGQAHSAGGLVICAVVYAELLAYPGASLEFVAEFLSTAGIIVEYELGEAVWREAGLRFARYAERRRNGAGGQPRRLLADFLIGSHALHHADRLLTLDSDRYVVDFQELQLLR